MSKVENPKVSVILPTYNRAHLVGRAIQSVLNQTYQNFELIVIDDGSTDNTEESVKGFNDSRIKYIRNEENKGGGAARNRGIKVAQGEYIAFLDSDDEWLPDKLRQQVACLEGSDSKVGAVYCAWYAQDSSINLAFKPNIKLYTGDVHELVLKGWRPGTSLFLVRRELLFKAGLFDPALPSFQEYDLWLRLSQLCYFEAVNAPLVLGHPHWGMRIATDQNARFKGLNMIINKWGSTIEQKVGGKALHKFYMKQISSIYFYTVLANVDQGKRIKSARAFLKYMKNLKYVTFTETLTLVIVLVGGKGTYRFVKKIWWRLKWKATQLQQ